MRVYILPRLLFLHELQHILSAKYKIGNERHMVTRPRSAGQARPNGPLWGGLQHRRWTPRALVTCAGAVPYVIHTARIATDPRRKVRLL